MLIDDLNEIDRELVGSLAKLIEHREAHNRRDTKALADFIPQADRELQTVLELLAAQMRAEQMTLEALSRYLTDQDEK